MRGVLLACFLLSSSCNLLQSQLPKNATAVQSLSKPSVVFESATLVEAPSQKMLQAYYCPKVVPNPYGVPGAAEKLCRQFFGGAPVANDMRVSFDLKFKVSNPNNIPVPLTEILTAATVFPERTKQSLGAVCVKLCPEHDATCQGGPTPTGCRDQAGDIRSMDDFRDAAVDFLITSGLKLAQGEVPTFKAPEIATSGDVVVIVRFSFGPDALLETMRQLAEQAVSQLEKGKMVTFEIPYAIEGTVWIDGGSLGRGAVSFGPVTGTWTIPTSPLSL